MHMHALQCRACGGPLQSSSPTDVLVRWLIEQRGLQPQRADVTCTDDGACTLIANQDTQAGQVCLWIVVGLCYRSSGGSCTSKGHGRAARSRMHRH